MKYIFNYFLMCLSFQSFGQNTSSTEFNRMVDSYLSFTVPLISVEKLMDSESDVVLLDAREKEEYDISHIPGAVCIGYDHPDFSVLKKIPKNSPIVIYCSIGYRSEKIGEKLISMGYTHVKNLYGSLFDWANRDFKLVNKSNQPTTGIHTFNKSWSKWITNPRLLKIY